MVDSVRISAHPSSSSDQAEDEEPKERKRSKSSKAYKDRGAESDLKVDELAVLLKLSRDAAVAEPRGELHNRLCKTVLLKYVLHVFVPSLSW